VAEFASDLALDEDGHERAHGLPELLEALAADVLMPGPARADEVVRRVAVVMVLLSSDCSSTLFALFVSRGEEASARSPWLGERAGYGTIFRTIGRGARRWRAHPSTRVRG
jgi:hypothetical protein